LGATRSYHGPSRRPRIRAIGAFATQGRAPDLTFLFDLDVNDGLARINRPKDRIENRSVEYHNRVKEGYLAIARQEPERVKVIEAVKSKEAICKIVEGYIDQLLSIG